MKRVSLLLVSALALSACMQASDSSTMSTSKPETAAAAPELAVLNDPNRISTVAAWNASVRGKTVTNEKGETYTFGLDGRVTGSGPGFTFASDYTFEDGFYCRSNGKVNDSKPAPDDCQVVILDGKTLTIVRNKGKGEARSSQIVN